MPGHNVYGTICVARYILCCRKPVHGGRLRGRHGRHHGTSGGQRREVDRAVPGLGWTLWICG